MADEPTIAGATAPPEPATAPIATATAPAAAEPKGPPAAKPGKQAAAPPAEPPTLEQLLESADPEFLRKHPKVAGIVGGMLRSEREVWDRQQKADTDRQAREAADRDLETMAKDRPLEFADKYLSDKEQARLRAQLDGIKSTTAQEYMQQIGRSFGEQFQLTADDVTEISKALSGKTDAEVLPAFNVAAADIIAKRKADALFAEWRAKELPKEREALRQEEAARLLKKSQRPSLQSSRPASTLKPHQLPEKEFNEWYEKEVLHH